MLKDTAKYLSNIVKGVKYCKRGCLGALLFILCPWFDRCQNHLENLLNHVSLDPIHQVFDSVSLVRVQKNCISNKFPGVAEAAHTSRPIDMLISPSD